MILLVWSIVHGLWEGASVHRCYRGLQGDTEGQYKSLANGHIMH